MKCRIYSELLAAGSGRVLPDVAGPDAGLNSCMSGAVAMPAPYFFKIFAPLVQTMEILSR